VSRRHEPRTGQAAAKCFCKDQPPLAKNLSRILRQFARGSSPRHGPDHLACDEEKGRAKFDIIVPNLTTLRGARLATQWAVFDPQGAFGGQLALSDALRLVVGQ
jgi:hypothetical protein